MLSNQRFVPSLGTEYTIFSFPVIIADASPEKTTETQASLLIISIFFSSAFIALTFLCNNSNFFSAKLRLTSLVSFTELPSDCKAIPIISLAPSIRRILFSKRASHKSSHFSNFKSLGTFVLL